jgi:hypothetical protein
MSLATTTEDLSGYKLFARFTEQHFKTIFETLKEL